VTAKKSLKYDRIQWLVDKPNQKTLDLILTFLNLSRVVVKWNSDSLFLLDRPVNWFIDVDVHNPSNGKCLFFWQD
jgi:hypothetical protein